MEGEVSYVSARIALLYQMCCFIIYRGLGSARMKSSARSPSESTLSSARRAALSPSAAPKRSCTEEPASALDTGGGVEPLDLPVPPPLPLPLPLSLSHNRLPIAMTTTPMSAMPNPPSPPPPPRAVLPRSRRRMLLPAMCRCALS